MNTTFLLQELLLRSAESSPDAPATTYQSQTLTYGELATSVERFAAGLIDCGVGRGERVGIYLEKRHEFVIAAFGAMAAGAAFVPLNPLLKSDQVSYIMRDCNVRVLVTSTARLDGLAHVLHRIPSILWTAAARCRCRPA